MQKTAFVFAAAALLAAAARPAEAQRREVRCESRDGRQHHCRVDTRGGVSLVRQLSDAQCSRGRSWGSDGSGIWVSRGCRGEFAVGGGLDGWQRRGGGDWNSGGRTGDRNSSGRWNGSSSTVCRTAVARRIGTRASSVDTWVRRQQGSGAELGWRAGRSDGTCRVDRSGRVTVHVDHDNSRDYDRDRDRGRDRDRDRDRGRDRDRDRDRDNHAYHN